MKTSLAHKLLRWYARHGRDLPWRRTRDPYAIWVSETMLQQTQVETVIPYYERFLARWSTLEALAAARLDDVLKMWEGLGYYARARNLHKGAQMVMREFGGKLPTDVASLQKIPGIGHYTACAIASIVYGQDEPALDGNLRRVLARLFAVRGDVGKPAVQKQLLTHARQILPKGRAADFNQALMDLGKTVCVPRKPRCPFCPLRADCRAAQAGLQNQLPVKAPKKPGPHHRLAVAVIWKRGRVLIAQRKAEGLLGGLWEFIGGTIQSEEEAAQACRRVVKAELGITVRVREQIATVNHAYTHFSATLHVFQCAYVRGIPKSRNAARLRWASPRELEKFAWSSANRKIVEQVTGKRFSPSSPQTD